MTDKRSSWGDGRATWMLVASGIIVVAFVIRMHGLGDQSFWFDEFVSWRQNSRGFWEIFGRAAQDNTPPLHNLFAYASTKLFGDTEWAFRLPSVMFGVATVAAMFRLASLLNCRLAGYYAALLLTFSAYHIWYSQEGRPYALLALLAVLLAISALRFLSETSIWPTVRSAVLSLGLFYTHPYGVPTWAAIVFPVTVLAFFDGLSARRMWQWLGGHAAAGVLFVPWSLILWGRTLIQVEIGTWRRRPTADYLLEGFGFMLGGPILLIVLTALVLFVVAVLAGSLLGRRVPHLEGLQESLPKRELIVVVSWLFVPILVAIGISWLAPISFYHHRYVIGTLPALMLLAGFGLALVFKRRVGFVFASMLIIALSVYGSINHSKADRRDWRTVAEVMAAQAQPDDCVVLTRHYQKVVFLHYWVDPVACVRNFDSAKNIDRKQISAPRLWFVSGLKFEADDEPYFAALGVDKADAEVFSLDRTRILLFDHWD